MADFDFDRLVVEYKLAITHLINPIHEQQSLAADGTSMRSMEDRDAGWSGVQDVLSESKKARDAYQNAPPREKNYSF